MECDINWAGHDDAAQQLMAMKSDPDPFVNNVGMI